MLASKIAKVDGLVSLLTDKLDGPVLDKAPKLKVVSNFAVGFNNIDVKACTEHGILVSAGHHEYDNPYSSTGELAWALILAALRHVPYEVERMKRGHWHSTVGTRLHENTLGVYAFGRIGAGVARVRLAPRGYADQFPVAERGDAASRAKNHRVSVVAGGL